MAINEAIRLALQDNNTKLLQHCLVCVVWFASIITVCMWSVRFISQYHAWYNISLTAQAWLHRLQPFSGEDVLSVLERLTSKALELQQPVSV